MKNDKKSNQTKQNTPLRPSNDQLGENASEEYKSASYDNTNKAKQRKDR